MSSEPSHKRKHDPSDTAEEVCTCEESDYERKKKMIIPPIRHHTMDLSMLTESEEEAMNVMLNKDEDFAKIVNAKVNDIRNEINAIRDKGKLNPGDVQHKICARCKYKFWSGAVPFGDHGKQCNNCHFNVCKKCRTLQPNNRTWICNLCLKQRQEKRISGEWIFSGTTLGLHGSDLLRASLRTKGPSQETLETYDPHLDIPLTKSHSKSNKKETDDYTGTLFDFGENGNEFEQVGEPIHAKKKKKKKAKQSVAGVEGSEIDGKDKRSKKTKKKKQPKEPSEAGESVGGESGKEKKRKKEKKHNSKVNGAVTEGTEKDGSELSHKSGKDKKKKKKKKTEAELNVPK